MLFFSINFKLKIISAEEFDLISDLSVCPVVTRFKARCFEFILLDAALVRSPLRGLIFD